MTRRAELPIVGAFRVGRALDAGVSRSRLRARDLQALARGARVPTGGHFVDAIAALLGPGQAFTGPTAAAIWGMPLPRRWQDDERVWVSTLSRDRVMHRPGVVGSRRIAGEVRSVRGFSVLGPARTWCSLGRLLEVHDLVAVADRIVTSRRGAPSLASPDDLGAALAATRHGAPALRSALGEMRVGSWSRTESLLRIVLVRAGLPEPILNTAVPIGRGRTAAPDLAWPDFMVCAEYDGIWHDDRRQRLADLDRHELLADAGWLVVRFRSRDLFPEPGVAVARVLRRLHERGYRHPNSIRSVVPQGWAP